VIVVTGASGNVGSALVAELRAAGHDVRAAYRSPERTAAALRAGTDAVTIDMSRPGTLPPALAGADAVFLLAPAGQAQPGQERNVIEAAATGVTRMVKLSIWRADEGLTPTARWHRPGEEMLQSSGLAWTFLRPNFYMQNFTRQTATSIRQARSFTQPAAHAPIAFVDAGDIARVAARVLTTPGHERRTYDITGPQALTYEETAGILSDVLGETVRYTALPDGQAHADMLRAGLAPGHADALIEVSRAYRHGGADRVTTVVRDLTGRAPVSFAEFARRNAAAFR